MNPGSLSPSTEEAGGRGGEAGQGFGRFSRFFMGFPSTSTGLRGVLREGGGRGWYGFREVFGVCLRSLMFIIGGSKGGS